MVKAEVDLSQPFLAIRKDVEGSAFDQTMGEYICNPLSQDLLDVEVSLGGFFSDAELGVLESKDKTFPLSVVPAGQAARFTISTWDEYCEFVCYWTVSYRTITNGNAKMSFGTFKVLADCQLLEETPVLGGRAYIVPRR